MNSSKPYLVSAVYEWIVDNDCTPHVLVKADYTGCDVPQEFAKDGQIVLNVAMMAVKSFVMDKEALSFSARFKGVEQSVYVPMGAVLGIFARENGQGMMFEADPEPVKPEVKSDTEVKTNSETPSKSNVKPFLKVVK
jgi:stringent starvation protein B